jgi:hypothetical protein
LKQFKIRPSKRSRIAAIALSACVFAGGGVALGQATPTASAGIGLSAFGGLSGVYTGISSSPGVSSGKNLSITAGIDVTFHPYFGLFPTAEVRGTYPVDSGKLDGQKNILVGPSISKHLGRLQPYGDVLFGRGLIVFNPPYPNPAGTILYAQTASGVISPGAGVNLLLTRTLGAKADFQFQKYSSPVTTSGSVYAKVFTLGVTYRPNLGGLGHGRRD